MKPVLQNNVIINAAVLSADDVTHRRVICPACGKFEFQMWPEGWDAHAEHRCEGLTSGTPEERKKEFKSKLKHLFK